jgi:hypothetical protein
MGAATRSEKPEIKVPRKADQMPPSHAVGGLLVRKSRREAAEA